MELVRAAVEASLDEQHVALSLRNVVWTRPIKVREHVQKVHVSLLAKEPGELAFEIFSPGSEAEPLVYSEGLARVSLKPADTSVDASVDLSRLRTECQSATLDAKQCYDAFRARGIEYGPGHRGIERLWIGERQVLARLTLPEAVQGTLENYGLHPSLLDSAFQACIGMMPREAAGQTLFLPFALDELEVLGQCAPSMWAWVRNSPEQQRDSTIRRLDIDLCDDAGHIRVRLKGVSSRAYSAEAATGELLASPCWIGKERAESANDTFPCVTLLVELPEIAERMKSRDAARVVLLGSNAQSVAVRYTEYALQIFATIKELLRERAQHKVRVQLVASMEESSLWMGLGGILKTAQLENPRILGQVVLVEPRDGSERVVSHIKADRAVLSDATIRYRNGKREILQWREDGTALAATPPWKDGGVYLITGGAGGLGTLFAQDIATHVRQPRLILTGRTPCDEQKNSILEQLRLLGAEATYEQVDVSVKDDVAALTSRIQNTYGRLDGILHSAGLIKDNFILKKTDDDFARVLAPKVAGLVNLDEATQDLALDFLIVFSSVAGVFGNVGQADYATANAFMDAYAHYRNTLVAEGRRCGRTLSLDWPLWADGGMHVDAGTEKSLRESLGLVPLQKDTGVRALYKALASQYAQVLVLEGERSRLRQTLLANLLAKQLVDEPAATSARIESHAPTQQPETDESIAQKAVTYFKKLLAIVIRLPVSKIDAEAPLELYGIDSVMTMDMTRTLEDVFGSLPKTLFFEYQTIDALTRYFMESFPNKMHELLHVGSAHTRFRDWNARCVGDEDAVATARAADTHHSRVEGHLQFQGERCHETHGHRDHRLGGALPAGSQCA
ncbi:SDR family NAD(P)-dependent oxidoreductase [Cystobacter fuscus]